MFDIDNWTIDTPSFLALNQKWGPFSVDMFASSENARVQKFFSLNWEEGSAGVNAFCQNITGEHFWACPPPRLISPTIKLCAKFGVTGVLCVPLWQASPFWTTLCPDGVHLSKFATDFHIFSPFFISGEDVTNKTFKGFAKFNMLAIRCNFSLPNALSPNKNAYFKMI